MNVLSLFDGMSCGQIALERAGIKVDNYSSSEIDKYAIRVTQANYPNTIQLGDINNWQGWKIEQPDIILAGSPCQGFSFAGKQLAFDDPRSALFFKFVDILEYYRPKYFLLENVKMKKKYQEVITKLLGVGPIEINSALVSAQNRARLYWTNIPNVTRPHDRGIFLKDIIESGKECITYSSSGRGNGKVESRIKEAIKACSLTKTGYSKRSLTAVSVYGVPHGFYSGWIKEAEKMPTIRKDTINNYFIINGEKFRKFTPVELERLQTVPDNYTDHASNSQRCKMLGNGWTVDVIAHVLKGI